MSVLTNLAPQNLFYAVRQKIRQNRQVRSARSWLPDDDLKAAFYAQFLKSGDLVFDVGANFGNRTKIFSRLGGRVIAFEPQPYCIEVLQQAFRTSKTVTIVPKGLGESPSKLELHLSKKTYTSSMSKAFIQATTATGRFGKETWSRSVLVDVITMDQAITDYGLPKFVKIDVEGFELSVLKGLTRPVAALSFEFTPECFDAAQGCVHRLNSLGKYRFQLSYGEGLEWQFLDWVQSDVLLDTLRNAPAQVFGDVYAKLAG